MKTANDRQVGGSHYAAAYQHWDMAMDYRLCHLAAAATKYLTRYEKKNGLEDVRKAAHYIEKWIERMTKGVLTRSIQHEDYFGACDLNAYMEGNGVPYEARYPLALLIMVDATPYPTTVKISMLHAALDAVKRIENRLSVEGVENSP